MYKSYYASILYLSKSQKKPLIKCHHNVGQIGSKKARTLKNYMPPDETKYLKKMILEKNVDLFRFFKERFKILVIIYMLCAFND